MSWKKIGKNKYQVRASLGTGKNRKRRSETVDTTLTGKRLERYLDQVEQELLSTLELPKSVQELQELTYPEFANYWLERNTDIEPSTRRYYERHALHRTAAYFDSYRLIDIKPINIIDYFAYLRTLTSPQTKKPYSDKTLRHYHIVLSTILKFAVSIDVLNKSPMNNLKMPKANQCLKDNYLDQEELREFLDVLDEKAPLHYQLMVHLAVTTGMRIGEIQALTWDDIKWQESAILVNKAMGSDGGRQFLKGTKSDAWRYVVLTERVKELLTTHGSMQDAHRKRHDWQGPRHSQTGYIFTSDGAKPLAYTTVHGWLDKFVAKHDLPKITWHGFRHTNATILIHSGVNIVTVSNQLGHKETSTTTNIYTHHLTQARQEIKAMFDTMDGVDRPNLKLVK